MPLTSTKLAGSLHPGRPSCPNATAPQQQRVRDRYPHTPVGELKLLPTDRRNPGGRRAITGFSLAFAHRTWVDRMPVLRTGDGIEYDKSKAVLYAYRHFVPA